MVALVEGAVYGMVASVGGGEVEELAVLLSLEDETAGRGRVVMVFGVNMVALKVSSSVICDLLEKKIAQVTQK